MKYYIEALTHNYANFRGRARRREYWMFVLINMVVGIIIALAAVLTKLTILPVIYWLVIFIPTFSLSVRRLHDVGKSAAWLLILLIPLIGGIWFLILTCTEGRSGRNEFGEDPKRM